MIELHVDDTADDDRQDVLTEISFHVPGSNQDFVASGSESAAKALLDQVLLHTDSGAASSDDVVCVFGDVAIMNPRGRFEVELHLNFLSLAGQVRDRSRSH
jgi:structure-specific recognition protein 1